MAVEKPGPGWDRLRQLSEIELCGDNSACMFRDRDNTGEPATSCVK